MVEMFAEADGNFLDTAVNYGNGESERVVGTLTAADRDYWVVATKYTVNTRPGDPNAGGNHRKSMVQALETSLRRLRTDHVDGYWMHVRDELTPIEEVVRALDVTVTAWSPLGDGLLTGRYGSDRPRPTEGRIAAGVSAADRLTDRNLAVADAVNEIAAASGASAAQLAIAWVRAQQHRAVVAPIVGARTPEQLRDNLGALDVELSADALTRLDAVSAIELGFPHDFGGRALAYGGTRDRIDDHRA